MSVARSARFDPGCLVREASICVFLSGWPFLSEALLLVRGNSCLPSRSCCWHNVPAHRLTADVFPSWRLSYAFIEGVQRDFRFPSH